MERGGHQIAPIIREFLFRGVIQQGLIGQLGLARGITLTVLLSMIRPVPFQSPARFVVAFIATFAMGWLLGIVRISSGTILGPIVLATLWSATSFGTLVFEDRFALPGMNVEGTHLPALVTLASVLLVGWAGNRVYAMSRTAAEAPADR